MNVVDATAKEHNLQLTLSPNLSLSVTTTLEVTRNAEAKIKLVKDEFKQVGSHSFEKGCYTVDCIRVFAIED